VGDERGTSMEKLTQRDHCNCRYKIFYRIQMYAGSSAFFLTSPRSRFLLLNDDIYLGFPSHLFLHGEKASLWSLRECAAFICGAPGSPASDRRTHPAFILLTSRGSCPFIYGSRMREINIKILINYSKSN
jgi:hypothetical protein